MELIKVLTGFPPCPFCDSSLDLRQMPDYGETRWHCPKCGTQWETGELISALNDNIILANELDIDV